MKPLSVLLIDNVAEKQIKESPDIKDRFDGDRSEFAITNLVVVNKSLGRYKASISRPSKRISGDEQSWTLCPLKLFLEAFPNTINGDIITSGESKVPGQYWKEYRKDVYSCYVTLPTGTLEEFKALFSKDTGFTLTDDDVKVLDFVKEIPNDPRKMKLSVDSPYLRGNVYLIDVNTLDTPFVNIVQERLNYDNPAVGTTPTTVKEILVKGAIAKVSLNTANPLSDDVKKVLNETPMSSIVVSDIDMSRYDDGSVKYTNSATIYSREARWGIARYTHKGTILNDGVYIKFKESTLADLPSVTEPGFYSTPEQFMFKNWLMVPKGETIKDTLAKYFPDIAFTAEEAKFRINGSGNEGAPDATFKFRGYYEFVNSLISEGSLYVRYIGE